MSQDYTDLIARLRSHIAGKASPYEAADAIDALVAERDELRKCLDDWLYANGPNGWINTLRSERDAAVADAERWRYLRSHCTFVDHELRSLGELIVPPIRRWYHDTNFTQYDTLDAAIDAARQSGAGEGSKP